MRVVSVEILGIPFFRWEFGTPPPEQPEPPFIDATDYPMRIGFEYPVDEELITHPLPTRSSDGLARP